MGITHCPLCIGLAVLCVVRATAHGTLLLSQPALEALWLKRPGALSMISTAAH
ncbi:MAG: hypothetical protein ACI9IO_000715 [Cyanobium sp.]|jgi:hypothetical protein